MSIIKFQTSLKFSVSKALDFRKSLRRFISNSKPTNEVPKSEGINSQIAIGSYPINYAKVGQGPHVVFCFPGILGNMKIHMVPQILNFDKEKFTFVTWDQPGYGFSSPPERILHDGSLEEDTDIMFEFMNKLGFNKYSVMGWSGGGCSALLAAIRHPEIVSKLVVWGTWSYVDEDDAKNFQGFERKENQKGKMMQVLVDEYGEDFFQKHFGGWMHLFYRTYAHHSGEFVSKRLNEIKCPTLILHGAEDGLISPKHAEFLNRNIKNSRLIPWPKAKHNLHLRYSEKFNEIVQHFLSE